MRTTTDRIKHHSENRVSRSSMKWTTKPVFLSELLIAYKCGPKFGWKEKLLLIVKTTLVSPKKSPGTANEKAERRILSNAQECTRAK